MIVLVQILYTRMHYTIAPILLRLYLRPCVDTLLFSLKAKILIGLVICAILKYKLTDVCKSTDTAIQFPELCLR